MSACLQRFRWKSQRANLPALPEPGLPDREGMGRAGPRWTALSAAGSASAGSASGSAGSACGQGKTARRRGSSCPPGLLARLPGIHVKDTVA